MSPKKITDADKLEIVDLYRQSGDTAASLATRYGVSNSTIGRLLKTSIPEDEYELLIKQKRGVKSSDNSALSAISQPGSSEDFSTTNDGGALLEEHGETSIERDEIETARMEYDRTDKETFDRQIDDLATATATFPEADRSFSTLPPTASMTQDLGAKRYIRRRSSSQSAAPDAPVAETNPALIDLIVAPETDADRPKLSLDTPISKKTILPPPISRTPSGGVEAVDRQDYFLGLTTPVAMPSEDLADDESEEDPDTEDVSVLAAMFGEEIADGDEEFTDEEDWEEEGPIDRLLTSDRLQISVTPLSQATLPRTCYITIDKFAELIVRPLKDFAELGQIPIEEIQQRTLPIFDNPRVAKRFSNQRTQRVIKVPDSRVFFKTTQHLRSKGITRLLVDGNIYSLD